MQTQLIPSLRTLWVTIAAVGLLNNGSSQILVKPARGGGLDTNAPMIHADIFYDYASHQMSATLDTSKSTPKLLPLPADYTFDSTSNYAVLNAKAYNYQYAWNPGGLFTNPPGAAVWIECLGTSPGLETYDAPGNKTISPPRTYDPIFGTAGSSTKWKWYGAMAHNTYAVLAPTNSLVTAQYRVYFGDATTGSRAGYESYGDATVTWIWNVDLPTPPLFRCGAADATNTAPLHFLDAPQYCTNALAVLTCRWTNAGPCASSFECPLDVMSVPATASNGGPAPNHAALGSCLALHLVSLAGPSQGELRVWERGDLAPCVTLAAGQSAGTNSVPISQNQAAAGSDPFGAVIGRHWALTQPGLFCLGFRLIDISTNGPAGSPIHTPSPLYHVYLQAGQTITALSRTGGSATVQFGGELGRTFYLQRASALGNSPVWQTVAGPLSGGNSLQSLTDATSTEPAGYFRLRSTQP